MNFTNVILHLSNFYYLSLIFCFIFLSRNLWILSHLEKLVLKWILEPRYASDKELKNDKKNWKRHTDLKKTKKSMCIINSLHQLAETICFETTRRENFSENVSEDRLSPNFLSKLWPYNGNSFYGCTISCWEDHVFNGQLFL